MSDCDPKMRQEGVHPVAKSAETPDQGAQQRPSRDLGLEENLRIVTENNLKRFVGCLYVEIDTTQRELYRNLLLREEQWFGVREERLEMLQRLVRDCDGQVLSHKVALDRQRAAGLDVTHAETLMTNMLDTQALLRVSLTSELRRY